MNRHVFRLLLLGLIAAVVLGAVGFGQTGNHPRLALQYWRAGDSPDWPVLNDEPVWVDGHEENSGQGHWEDFNGDGEEDGWVSEAYWVDGTWQSVWVEGDPLPDGVFGSSWATDAGTFNINSASSTWSSAGTWHSGGYTRGNLLFPFGYYDIITFRAWGLAPANNCNFYSYGVYRPDGSLETGNSGVGWSFPGGSAVMDGSFFASQNGVWRIDVRYHNATGVSPEAGTVSYYLTVGPALPQTTTFDSIPTHAFGDAPFALPATAESGLPVVLSVISGPATLSGNMITLTGNGAVTVRAAQAGGMVSGTFWNAAPPVDRTFSVIGIAQTISFDALPGRTQTDPPFALTATASSGLPVTFSVTAGPAIISGNVVSLTGAGTVVITAVQNGGGVFGSALTVSRSFTVSPVPPPEITSANVVEALVGTQFDYEFTFSRPVSAMIWDAGYLPAGLEWSGPLGGMYGRISGTPTVSGIFSLVFRPWGAVGVGPSFTLVIDVKTSSGLSVPTIITQPQNRIAAAGAYVFLNVHASSASSYLWYKDGAALTYQISPFMVVFAAGAVDVGTYAVVVRNSAGSVTSAPATLSVEGLPPPPPPVVGALPVIITQPQDLTVPAGQAASYTVAAASATPLAYQWLRNGVLIAGATANSFSILQTSYASNGHFYSVVVSNSAGSVTSAAAELLVTGPVLTVSHLLPNSFRLTWTTETSGGNDVSYRVLIRDFIDTANATQPFDVVGLAPATTYAVEVQAIDYAGTVFRSVPLRITTPAASGVAPVAAKNTARSVQRAAFATSQPVVRTLTTVASPPAPLPSQWLDVWVGQKHGKTWIKTTDGIMDEVMDLNDPGRNALISITGVTHTYTYTALGTAGFSPFTLFWALDPAAYFGTSSFSDISDPDGNYAGPVGLDEESASSVYFVHVETNYTGDAEFELEPGYDYGVYSMTNGNDANDPSKWGFEGSPTPISGTTRGRLEMSDIQPPTKKWYRLVKYSTPIGSVRFSDAAGSVLVDNVSVDNTAAPDLWLPADGHGTISLRDLANNWIMTSSGPASSGGNPVAWKIYDLLGNIIRAGTGTDVDLRDLSVAAIRIGVFLGAATPRILSVSIKPAVSLNRNQDRLTLMDTLTLEAVAGTLNASENARYVFQMSRGTGSPVWHNIGSGGEPTLNWTVRVAGTWRLRVAVTARGATGISGEKTIVVAFPTANTVLAAPDAKARMDQAWSDTLNATTMTSRREEGYYVTLNTATGAYGITGRVVSPSVANDVIGSVGLSTPRPPDSIASPSPVDSPTYVVAWFHTHTPMTYRGPAGSTRIVGPSGRPGLTSVPAIVPTFDHAFSEDPSVRLPGYAYDYVESAPGLGTIPSGWPLNSPARVYLITPPDLRDLP